MDDLSCEVLVVGSGPAGASAASALSRSGVEDVIVLERLSPAQHRRYHSVCGEAVSDRMLRDAGIVPPRILRRVSEIRLTVEGAEPVLVRAKGCVVDRSAMLEDLLERSSARRVRASALRASKTDGGYLVETTAGTVRCGYLIGADGAFSVVRRDLFGTRPERMVKAVNAVVPEESDGVLGFSIGSSGPGAYSWRFPSSEGCCSIGFVKGSGTVPDGVPHGGRCIPVGRVPEVARGGCALVGDAAGMPYPISYGGIGPALVSGRRAAEAVASGDLRAYSRWAERARMLDRRFMDAARAVEGWTPEQAADAMRPLAGRATVPKGIWAMMRKPSYSRIYMACWMGFRIGW